MRKKIHIKFQNGISYTEAMKNIFFEIQDIYEFIETKINPDFILFAPYGNDIPPTGPYTRIGYFSENITPDLTICDWAFGIPLESEIKNYKYRRIQWHGIQPDKLVKNLTDNDLDKLINTKLKFCNFLYSHAVPYREEFFRQLNKYRKVDAPGKSMNNMESIDHLYKGNFWERKNKFLSEYKFTISFENYTYPGYQTEKLYDPMLVNSLPIYSGDPFIAKIFNEDSFINISNFCKPAQNGLISFLEHESQMDFKDYRPTFYNNPINKIKRKIKSVGRNIKMSLQFKNLDFSNVIDYIREVDRNDDLYRKILQEPWLKNNKTPQNSTNKDRWIEIFDN